jgi:hypothetical protein
MNQRLVNQMALEMAQAILNIVSPCLRPEEHKGAFGEFAEVCRAGIEAYEIQMSRMRQRLLHSDN